MVTGPPCYQVARLGVSGRLGRSRTQRPNQCWCVDPPPVRGIERQAGKPLSPGAPSRTDLRMLQRAMKTPSRAMGSLDVVRAVADALDARLRTLKAGASLRTAVRQIRRGLLHRRVSFIPEPSADVRANGAGWESTSADPRFLLRSTTGRFSRGWVEIELELHAEDAQPVRPRLYIDSGAGFRELDSVLLPTAATGITRAVIRLPDVVQALRLDPLDRPGHFTMGPIVMTELSRPGAAMRLAEPALRNLARDPRLIPGALEQGIRMARTEGWKGVKERLRAGALNPYAAWLAQTEIPSARYPELVEAQRSWPSHPKISVLVPTYETPEELLRATLDSVRAQVYPHWELCIADDASRKGHVRKVLEAYAAKDSRIRVSFRETNGHISAASNTALRLATGEWIALLDHDDLLHPLALYHVAGAIARNPSAGLVFTDEDKIDALGIHHDPYFKCDFNYELFLASNMVSHLGVYRRLLVEELGGFRKSFEGAQDYDLALRVIERLQPAEIIHVPKVLYHWRVLPGSTSMGGGEKPYAASAARRAIEEHLMRMGVEAKVEPAPNTEGMNRVRFAVPSPQPHVSIIIPTRDRADLLAQCLDSIESRSTYRHFEVIIIDNGSREPETAALLTRLSRDRYRVLRDESPFNYSALNNRAVRQAEGELICLMNNDIEIISPDWMEEMVSFAWRPGVGAVGARLWYPDGRLQHGGVIVGLGGVAGHAHKYLSRGSPGYFYRAQLHQSFSAVTAACLMIRRSVYDQVDGLDEALEVAFNDVDFCLRVREAGYRNVWTPYAEMIHHESASRGEERTPEQKARFQREIEFIQRRWQGKLRVDPAYSPNLTLEAEDFSIAASRGLIGI